ncbi:MAG TPA: hypothetical protein VJR90_00005, partial [Gammaproteobacteria bacterium]|nr:hypothetical protein [Gammaproteobacteria bacterium]
AVQKQVTQTQDAYGNLTQMQVYDWGAGAPGPLLRTYTNTYLTDSNYISRYIFNRLLTSKVTGGGYNATLVSNAYDTYGTGCAYLPGLSGPANPAFHDAAYSSTFYYRGNATQSTTPAGWSCRALDILGNTVGSQDAAGRIYTANVNSSTNYAAPSAITANNTLTENLSWSPFLGLMQETGPNRDSSGTFYDAYARPASTTSPYGATTSYSYTTNTTTATVNGRWTKTTVDGFARPLLVETGYGSTTVSQVDYVYGPCGCSPIGKLMQKSQPHAPNATKYWTKYTYDGIGRTIAVQLPDGASTTGYAYWSNVVQVTDPAQNWKQFVQDANGNLVVVREPNPAFPGDDTRDLWTYYSYDILNHLTNVTMTGPGAGQTRAFNYTSGTVVGAYLLSKTEPETGTTNYTYSGGLLQTKVDAKNQKTQYTYDSYGRVTTIQHYPVSTGSEDVCQRVMFYYDTNPFVRSYSLNALGRQTAVQYQGAGCGNITPSTTTPVNPNTFVEMYNYSPAGLIVGNELLVSQLAYQAYPQTPVTVTADLEASYGYDNEGRMTSVQYPSSAGSGFTGDNYSYSFDSLGRPVGLTDQTTLQTAVNGVTYGPAGEMLTMGYGGMTETRTYNSLLQLTGIGAYHFG